MPARQAPWAVPVLEIGGTHVTAALVDLRAGSVLRDNVTRHSLNPLGGAEEILGAIVACGRTVAAPAGADWGVAVPGPFDYERGVGLFARVAKFESLYGVDVGDALLAGLPGPPHSMTFLNDADAFLWGEWLFGAAAGYDPCVGITLGTGIGSAFLSAGEVRQSGPGVPPEGRVDLLSIAGRPLEEVVSTRAVERAYEQRARIAPRGAAFVAERARAGDSDAAEVLGTAFENLGTALRPWLEGFGAKALVVGGSMTGSWDLISPALLRGLAAGGPGLAHLNVSVAAHPEHAALLGAAAFARHNKDEPRAEGPARR